MGAGQGHQNRSALRYFLLRLDFCSRPISSILLCVGSRWEGEPTYVARPQYVGTLVRKPDLHLYSLLLRIPRDVAEQRGEALPAKDVAPLSLETRLPTWNRRAFQESDCRLPWQQACGI